MVAAVGRRPATTLMPAPRPQLLRPQESRMDWGYVLGFGFKGAIFEHLYQLSRISSSHRSHYDQVHSGAMMIVTEDVSCRSNRCLSFNIKNQCT
uniref:Uncharacterized protein n=1 Tax=Triticum urartu TaxID=4572 RepID=A0A8R7V1A0_TRIUA